MSRKKKINEIVWLLNERLEDVRNPPKKYARFSTYKKKNRVVVSYTEVNKLSNLKLDALNIVLLAARGLSFKLANELNKARIRREPFDFSKVPCDGDRKF